MSRSAVRTDATSGPTLITLVCRLLGHRWVWCSVQWNTGERTEEDLCRRCGATLEAVA